MTRMADAGIAVNTGECLSDRPATTPTSPATAKARSATRVSSPGRTSAHVGAQRVLPGRVRQRQRPARLRRRLHRDPRRPGRPVRPAQLGVGATPTATNRAHPTSPACASARRRSRPTPDRPGPPAPGLCCDVHQHRGRHDVAHRDAPAEPSLLRVVRASPHRQRGGQPGVVDLLFGNPHDMPIPAYVEALQRHVVPQHPGWFAYMFDDPGATGTPPPASAATPAWRGTPTTSR